MFGKGILNQINLTLSLVVLSGHVRSVRHWPMRWGCIFQCCDLLRSILFIENEIKSEE